MTSAHEERLVAKAKAGNERALTKLLKYHYQQLYATAFQYTHNKQDALDVIQEAACRAVQRLDLLQEEKYFGTWITRIVINEAIRFLQTQQKQRGTQLNEQVPDANGDPTNTLDHFELHQALGELDEKYSEVLILHYLQGWSVHEIATSFDVSDNTIKTRLARGRSALRTELE